MGNRTALIDTGPGLMLFAALDAGLMLAEAVVGLGLLLVVVRFPPVGGVLLALLLGVVSLFRPAARAEPERSP